MASPSSTVMFGRRSSSTKDEPDDRLMALNRATNIVLGPSAMIVPRSC
jgi:hypothetical protein